MKKSICLLPALFLLSSCATIFCGSKKHIVLESNIPSAEQITIDGHLYQNVIFPFNVKVKRGFSESIIRSKAKGYQPLETIVDKEFNPVSIINLFSIVGWGIDAATGAMMKPEYDSYNLEFVPINQ